MQIEKNISLQPYNTFGIHVKAAEFLAVSSEKDLSSFFSKNKKPVFILGGGSNLLLTKNVKSIVVKNNIKGIKVEREFQHSAYVSAGGGEDWHQFVLWCIKKGLGGIENLSLIPGTVGASPIQNIGAYGVELKDVFHKLEAVEIATGEKFIFRKKDCAFGYRDSIFKKKLKGKFCITRVWLKLSKRHQLKISYGAIRQTLAEMKIKKPTIKNISKAVIKIRSSKLPDPNELGNSGSFFKNPEISQRQFKALQKKFPNIVFYPLENGKVKLPAGWLIEQCGWKGKRVGNTGAHAKQALVLVNYGGATGTQVKKLAYRIIDSVKKKFEIELSAEVNLSLIHI